VSGLRLSIRQVYYTNKAFWRNPAAAFFTFAFPLMFLIIFTTLLGNNEVPVGGREVSVATYYVAAMATFSIISACFTNIAMSVSFQRDDGILKRTRGTPLPGWSYLTGRVLHASLIAVLLVVICAAFGSLVYGADIPTGATLARFLVTLLVGAASFAALGLAVTCIVPNADSSPAIVNGMILPILFLSGIFIPIGDETPAWVRFIGDVFPVAHFADAMQSSFLGVPFRWSDVLVIAAWGVGGLIVGARFFSWEPRR